ncbi:hypothetical protein [Flavobacterium sp. K5-23]|uniref:hypothetical protein n=1 Tax=Flavobacterium sp. K5-23 TaxID=2746225 RepID=UPI00200EB3E4|nr:hypothetical protein [Flavobacterium sp. K5-23]UQD57202.1 hypothetical protein FLAK523_12690 [Flavobacterium sp. K5-23]
MLINHKHILFILFLCYFQVSFSQNNKKKKDTSDINRENQLIIQKSNFPKFIKKHKVESNDTLKQKKTTLNYIDFEGKIIRNIFITTLDPFGYSDLDTIMKPKGWIQKTGNRIHIKTKKLAIRNLLLLKKHTPFDSIVVKESERLLRTQNYVNQANITQQLISPESDSVDVFVRVLDSWSTVPQGSFISSESFVELKEYNFLGLGHRFDNKYTNSADEKKKGYETSYTIPNIKNTYIGTKLSYHKEVAESYGKSIAVERPFFSPLTKWAGGIYLDQQFLKDTLQGPDLQYAQQNIKFETQDYWMGKSFRIFKENTIKDRTTNLILTGRYLNINYLESPLLDYDTIRFYSKEHFILTGIGINSRKFVKDRFIFKNGIIEDVPIGRIYGVTVGYQYKNNNWKPYLGFQFSYGSYNKWGFLSTNIEFGSFFDNSKTEQTAFSISANYFTNLIKVGSWKLRQFVKPQIIIGLNRLNTPGDRLTLIDVFGSQDFNSTLNGTKKIALTLQTQAYSPWSLWGFRLNPYFNYSIAMLSGIQNSIKNKPYSKIGIGLIINNDYLVFSSFQLSIAYYPSTPSNGDNVFRINSFETSDYGLHGFELAKPRTLSYK